MKAERKKDLLGQIQMPETDAAKIHRPCYTNTLTLYSHTLEWFCFMMCAVGI